MLGNLILFEVSTLPYLASAAFILLGLEAGLYWFAAAVVLSTAKAILDSWVLLVEIDR